MSRLFETMMILDGAVRNVGYHNARMNRSRRELFGATDELDVRVRDLKRFSQVMLINALRDFNLRETLMISDISRSQTNRFG